MRNMLIIIKNNYSRAVSQKGYILISLAITFLMILLAVYFTSRFEMKGTIAWVSNSGQIPLKSGAFTVKAVDEIPPKSQLVMNRYHAIVIDKGNGEYVIDTIRGRDFREKLEKAVRNRDLSVFEGERKRGPGTNILGYLTMFILIQGLFFMNFFTEDKTGRAFKRIATSPVSVGSYLAAHCLFNFFMVCVPTLAVLAVDREILKVDLGFSYLQYIFLVGLLTMLATAFALFMSSIVEKSDDVMAWATTIILLTSILSGTFSSIQGYHPIFENLISLLPQHSFMALVQGVENGRAAAGFLPQIGHLILLSLLLGAAGTAVCQKRFAEGRYC